VINAQTTSAAQTQELAGAVASLSQPADLLVLAGDLGAGKTAFTQGFGAALGVKDQITSPTFTLANEYEGRLRLHHLDVYRIEQLEEVRDLALAELLDDGAITVIEWGDTIARALPNDYLEIRLTYGTADDHRDIALRCVGPRWAARSGALLTALDAWMVEPC